MSESLLKPEDLSSLNSAIAQSLEGVVRRIKEDFERREEDVVLEALAKFAGADPTQQSDGGVFESDRKWIGYMAHEALGSDMGIPLAVPCGPDGKVSEADVKEAFNVFMGMTAIAPDDVDKKLMIMKQSEQAYDTDPHAGSIVTNMRNYIVGTGVQINCTVQELENYIREFWMRNSMNRRLKEAVARKYINGEHFFAFFIGNDGTVTIRDKTRAHEVQHVHTHSEDAETRLVYGRYKGNLPLLKGLKDKDSQFDWFADVNYFERLEKEGKWMERAPIDGRTLKRNKLMMMCKYGATSDVRGEPQMYRILRFLKFYYNFLIDRVILNHERTKVVWIKKITGRGRTEDQRNERGPRQGQILRETDGIEWRAENAKIGADDAKEDGRIIRMAIAAGVLMPEHILFQDPSNNVYASLRKQDTPFAQQIRSHQQDWEWDLQEMIRIVLREGVKAGRLKKNTAVATYTFESQDRIEREVFPMLKQGASKDEIYQVLMKLESEAKKEQVVVPTELVPFEVDLPEIVQEDPTVIAKRAEIALRNRLASRTTLAKEMGYNLKQEERLAQLEGGWPEPQGKAAYGKGNNADDNANSDKPENNGNQ